MPTIEDRVTTLEAKVESLEKARPGRKGVPIVAPKQEGVCAIDPDRDSASCPNANVYRYQQGCLGAACKAANVTYYAEYRAKNKTTQEVVSDV